MRGPGYGYISCIYSYVIVVECRSVLSTEELWVSIQQTCARKRMPGAVCRNTLQPCRDGEGGETGVWLGLVAWAGAAVPGGGGSKRGSRLRLSCSRARCIMSGAPKGIFRLGEAAPPARAPAEVVSPEASPSSGGASYKRGPSMTLKSSLPALSVTGWSTHSDRCGRHTVRSATRVS